MNKNWESPSCAICETKKYLSILWEGVTTWEHQGQFSFVKCSNCGLVFQSPRAPFSEVLSYYPSKSYWGRDVRRLKKTLGLSKERERAYSHLYKGIFSRKNSGKILDIGSGLGLFLSKFKEKDWDVLGTDISRDIGKYSENIFKIKVLIGDVVKLKLPANKFDLVTMNGVFEHIYNPKETLLKVRNILKKDGLLVIVVPNIESLGYLIHKNNWHQLQPGRHVYHYSPKTITRILADCGFRIDKINHFYWAHNYYSLYENIRFRFSPRFEKAEIGGLTKEKLRNFNKPSKLSIRKEVGKFTAKILATLACIIEPLINRGEVITVYAKKV